VELGVPAEHIAIDSGGTTTRATIRNTCALFPHLGVRRILAVSHFYHLPRIKMGYQAAGLDVYTVPARETYLLTRMPWFVARECAVWWFYYLGSVLAISK
jgi:uncharacterized SAM-binding protein YcdF (DUF218 family)